VLLERYAALGVTTNNVAEYTGLIAGLRAAAELGATRVDVRMDSKLVIEQMSGRWQIKNPGLRPLAAEAAKLVDGFAAVTFDWIPRERNKLADALANRRWTRPPASGSPTADTPAFAGRPRPRPRRTGRRRRWTRDPADPGPARRDRADRAGPLLRARRRPALRQGEAQAMAAAGRVAGISRDVTAVSVLTLERCTCAPPS
jgi:hypothetical protein